MSLTIRNSNTTANVTPLTVAGANLKRNLFEMMTIIAMIILATVIAQGESFSANLSPNSHNQYYGSPVGKLNGPEHNLSGNVFAVDEQTLFIKSFTYDGLASDAYFWSSVTSTQPTSEGFIVPDEKGSTKPLERYQNKDIVLRLPEGKTLREINWLSIWSRPMKSSVADIMISKQLVIPHPLEISPLSQLKHNVKSGPITIVDAQTFLVPDFHYDGLGPAGYFWLTRGGLGLGPNGVRLKDENGSSSPLRKYSGETVVISLPENLTIYDFDYFGVWCTEFAVNFGQTKIPHQARVPPSPKMLGIKPENKLNCEILYDDLGYEIRWVLDGDDIVMQLVGKIEPNEYMAFGLGKNDSKSDMTNADAVVSWVDRQSGQVHAVDYYLGAKGQCIKDPKASCPDVKLPGGGDSLTLLHGAIVNGYSMVTFKRPQLGVDEEYDQHVYSDGQQSVMWAIGVLNAQKEIGYHRLKTKGNMFIDFARNPQWNCPIPDLNASMHNNLPIPSASQVDSTVVSALPSAEVSSVVTSLPNPSTSQDNGRSADSSIPSSASTRNPQQTQLARLSSVSLPPKQVDARRSSGEQYKFDASQRHPVAVSSPVIGAQTTDRAQQENPDPWFIPSVVCPADRTFYAQIGPTGGRRGYEGVTGRPSWGVSWYINGLLIPELVLERGQTYRFVIEGGNDKASLTRRHPFYLTDDPDGGFNFKTDDERQREHIFAGVALRGDGQFVPTAEGRLCEWRPTNQTLADADLYPTFSAYQRTLKLDCLSGQASLLKFTPDSNTPNLIYYQCYTNRFMGWKIRVVDSCGAHLNSMDSKPRVGGSAIARVPGNNNFKRDTSRIINGDQTMMASEPKPTFYRRQSNFPMDSASLLPPDASELGAFDFGDDSSASSFSTELKSIPNDMVIMNASLLTQKQPVNFSMLEQILKKSPNDLEIVDENFAANNFQQQNPLNLDLTGPNFSHENMNMNQIPNYLSINQTQKQMKVIANPKPPKTLQSYMRRLASIYYPMQQQLASILPFSGSLGTNTDPNNHNKPLTSNNKNTLSQNQPDDQVTSASGEQPAGFSLSNLVPKSKIDLSKSNISKKLNKLRIKSGRKYEPNVSGSKVAPPTPANEFNYHIFNNQLAQLENQNKQYQSLELAAWPIGQQSSEQTINYLPIMSSSAYVSPQIPMEFGESQKQSSTEEINATNQLIGLSNMLNSHSPQHPFMISHDIQQQLRSPTYQSQPQVHQLRQQPIPLNIVNQQTRYIQRLPSSINDTQSFPNSQGRVSWPSQQIKQDPRQAVFITRLPNTVLPQSYQPHSQAPRPNWPQDIGSARYPNVNPYRNNKPPVAQDLGYQGTRSGSSSMSTMPSVTLSIYDSKDRTVMPSAEHQHSNQISSIDPGVDSLSGSSSGSNYDFTYQNDVSLNQNSPDYKLKAAQFTSYGLPIVSNRTQVTDSNDLDHMLAIERFSKHASESRSPSIVDPITGEQVQYQQPADQRDVDFYHSLGNGNGSSSSSHIKNSPRYSKLMTHEPHIIKADSLASGNSLISHEILDVDQSVQTTSELHRLNSTSSLENMDSTDQKIQRSGQYSISAPNLTTPISILEYQTYATTNAPVSSTLVTPQTYNPFDLDDGRQMMTTTPETGPLVPSMGPPIAQPSGLQSTREELILKSTLVDPITSSLVTSDSTNSMTSPLVSSMNFDSNPFIPIELKDPTIFYMKQQQERFANSQLQANRLKQPALIESMLSQYQSPFRPEPPVKVASYLANQLSNHNPLLVSSERSVTSSKPIATSSSISNQNDQHNQRNTSDTIGNNSDTARSPSANELIILKPAILTKLSPQTYALKPEFMTNQFKFISDNSIHNSGVENDHLYYTGDAEPARRLAGHQFERLSSLSSPPSTSFSMDPIQASNAIATYLRTTAPMTSTESHKQLDEVDVGVKRESVTETSEIKGENVTKSTSSRDEFKVGSDFRIETPDLLKHRKTSSLLQTIPLSFESTSSQLAERTRLSPGGENTNTIPRDNNTDNAILSHVMSLISSNAVPAPLVPISSYSAADFYTDRLQSRSIMG